MIRDQLRLTRCFYSNSVWEYNCDIRLKKM